MYGRRRRRPRAARLDAARWCCPTSTTSRRRRSTPTTRSPSPRPRWADCPTGWTSRSTSATGRGVPARDQHMPQWAGSCWYELRYLDPTNDDAFVDPAIERYWMGPQTEGDRSPAASTSTSAASSTRCCTCSTPASGTRCCSTSATCRRPSRSAGCSTRATSRPPPTATSAGIYVEAAEVEGDADAGFTSEGEPVTRECGQDGQEPEELGAPRRDVRGLRRRHPAPVRDVQRPARPDAARGTPATSSACSACCSGSGASWSTRRPARPACVDAPADDATSRLLHRTIAGVRDGMEALRFNTSIAKLIELNNHLTELERDARARSPSRWC